MQPVPTPETAPTEFVRAVRQYSLRDLLVFIATVAAGFAVTKLPGFGIVDGLFATASLLVVVGLISEIRFIRKMKATGELDRFSRAFHTGWRVVLALAPILHYVTGNGVFALRSLSYVNSLESQAAASLLLLQLAIFCSITLDVRPRPAQAKSSKLANLLTWIAIVLFVMLVLRHNWMGIVILVQFAVESMEFGAPMDIYSEGGPLFGVDPNVKQRAQHFAWMSIAGFLSLGLLVAAVRATISRLRRRQPVRRAAMFMMIALAIASAYPIWVYAGGGLRGFSPPFAEASFHWSWPSTIAAACSVVLLTTMLTYRFLGVTRDMGHATTGSWPLFIHYHPTTLAVVAVASLSWIALSWEIVWGPPWQFVLAPLSKPIRYISVATICVIVSRIVDRWRSKCSTGSPPAIVDPTACAIAWPAIAMTIVVGVPTLLWSIYSMMNVYVRW